jgi:hypothetical protein
MNFYKKIDCLLDYADKACYVQNNLAYNENSEITDKKVSITLPPGKSWFIPSLSFFFFSLCGLPIARKVRLQSGPPL